MADLSSHIDRIAKAFNERAPANWKARPFATNRKSGVYAAVSFTYRGGAIQFLMDASKPVFDSFSVKVRNHDCSFGVYMNMIQKGLHIILSRLYQAGLAIDLPPRFSPSDIMVGVRKGGDTIQLRIVEIETGKE